MKNVAVFYGGQSVEKDISILTGVIMLNAVNKKDFNPVPIFVNDKLEFFTGEVLFDIDFYKNVNYKQLEKVVLCSGDNILYKIKGKKRIPLFVLASALNCMHGGFGEDGGLAGLLNLCKIPLASPGYLPSSIAMDKSITKLLLKGIRVKTLPSIELFSIKEVSEVKEGLSYPVIVKPNRLGSSIGIEKVECADNLENAVSVALRYGESVIIEPCLTDFIEINCACYKNTKGELVVSECEKPVGVNEVLSFGDKYLTGKREFPAKIDRKFSDKIKAITKKVYNALKVDGVIRIDYFIYDNNVYLNEINTVPGSLAYYLFTDTVKDFSNVISQLIYLSERKWAKEQTSVKSYPSSVLTGFGSKGAKHL